MTESDKARAWKKHNISNAEYDAGWERIFGQNKNGLKPCPKCGGDLELVSYMDVGPFCLPCFLEALEKRVRDSMYNHWVYRERKSK